MELIERYLYAVTKRLPEGTRADVEKELRGNIEDMLPEGYSESDVKEVLLKLGDPARLADDYRGAKRYLIGPELYDNYLSVLKLVVGIASGVLLCVGMLAGIVDNTGKNFVDVAVGVFTAAVSAALEGALQAAGWVTVVFAIMERTDLKEGKLRSLQKKWTPDALPPVPVKTARQIRKSEAIAHMVFATFFTAILCTAPGLFGWYEKSGDSLVRMVGLFNEETMRSYIPAILVLFAAGIFVAVLKFIVGRWTLLIATANFAYNVLFCVMLSFAIAAGNLFNDVFLNRIQTVLGISPSEFVAGWNKGVWTAAAVIIVISFADSLSGYYKSLNITRKRT